MIGAIAGDVIGSVFEYQGWKSTEFPLFCAESTFTDDSVLTVAVAAAILDGRGYGEAIRDFGRRYPGRGYGGFFHRWLDDASMGPYNSWGNGSAMRVAPVRWPSTVDLVLAGAGPPRSPTITRGSAREPWHSPYSSSHGADKATI
jgi:ADP-ribosylglycohydrolase